MAANKKNKMTTNETVAATVRTALSRKRRVSATADVHKAIARGKQRADEVLATHAREVRVGAIAVLAALTAQMQRAAVGQRALLYPNMVAALGAHASAAPSSPRATRGSTIPFMMCSGCSTTIMGLTSNGLRLVATR